MPIDIKLLREDAGGNPELVRESQRRRFADVTLVDQVLEKDAEWRKSKYRLDSLAQRRNAVQKEVAVLRKSGQDATEKQSLIKSIGEDIKTAQTVVSGLEEEMAKLLPKIGNIVAKDVPTSNDEEKDNEIVSTFGECSSGEGLLHHHEVLYRIEGYEPERGVGVAGHRAYFLRDAGLLLNQALISYSLAFLRKRGYSVLQPPYFMNRDIMAGVAQLEQFDEELYRVTGDGIDDKYLIATSEQPLCGFHKGEWMNETELPLRYGGMSTCFRKEAGAHGKDTWGIFRVHQFDKIEQFCITEGSLEKSEVMHQEVSVSR
jgi:seryl-tRNA synthetase